MGATTSRQRLVNADVVLELCCYSPFSLAELAFQLLFFCLVRAVELTFSSVSTFRSQGFPFFCLKSVSLFSGTLWHSRRKLNTFRDMNTRPRATGATTRLARLPACSWSLSAIPWRLHSGSKKASDVMLRLCFAWVRKKEADWFEFNFRNDLDLAHPGTYTYLTIVFCRD